MDKIIDATIASINATGVAAPLVFVLLFGWVVMGATIKRLFSLYTAAMESRFTEKDKTMLALFDAVKTLEKASDAIIRAGTK